MESYPDLQRFDDLWPGPEIHHSTRLRIQAIVTHEAGCKNQSGAATKESDHAKPLNPFNMGSSRDKRH